MSPSLLCVCVCVCVLSEGEEQLLWEVQLPTILLPNLLDAANPSSALSAAGESAASGGTLTVLGESRLCLPLHFLRVAFF